MIKTAKQIRIMAEGGHILAGIMEQVAERVAPGVRLRELDHLARTLIREADGVPSFLNYRPAGATRAYPAAICTSVNDTIVHGIPGAYALRDGDVLKLDFGLFYKGFHTDSAFTIGVGAIPAEVQKLIDATRQALANGIAQARAGNTLGDIGHAIERTVLTAGFHVVEQLTGHGIGTHLHEDPYVFNTGTPKHRMKLAAGMTLAIEPMTAIGTTNVVQRPDDSFATSDGSIAAHFEHTIVITKVGPHILTM